MLTRPVVCGNPARQTDGWALDGPATDLGFHVSLRRTTPPGEPLTDVDLLRPSQLRRIGRASLRYWGLMSLADVVELVLSELVSNAFLYGCGPVGVRMWRAGSQMFIEVSSEGPGVPSADPAPAAPLSESGRGLFLVAAVADAWDVSPDGSRVRCALTVPGGGE
ncbi:ATP-binding protein [Streptomyces sp. NPDC055078]